MLAAFVLIACGGDGGSSATGNNSSTGDGSNDAGTLGIVQIGNGLGASFVLGEIGIENPNLQSGGSTQLQITFVDDAGNAIIDSMTAVVSSNCLANGLASLEGDLVTSTGDITLEYTANGCSGSDVITANANTIDGQSISASGVVNIEPDSVLSLQFISATPTELSLRGVGGSETAQVVFRLVGQQSAPIVGEEVSFSLSTEAGGISLAETSALSDNSGEVTAIVQSGTVHTTVVVTATHVATNVSGSSAGINISTGVAQAHRFSLALDVFNPRAFDINGVEVVASVIVADQFGNPVPDGTVVSFASPEGGTIPPSCSTMSGTCESTWLSSNPRPDDGRATIIAFTNGAEEFTDVNGNSVFDDGDIFTAAMDLDEPYVDENDNMMYDAGEYFFDFNSNGSFDVADGLWNGPLCEHSSLCGSVDEIGISRTATIDMATSGVQVLSAGDFGASGSTIPVVAGSRTTLNSLIMSDLNGNSMPNETELKFEATLGSLVGGTDFSVGSNTTLPNGPYRIVYDAPLNAISDTLTLTVDVPGVAPQVFFWQIEGQCVGVSSLSVANVTATEATISWEEDGLSGAWYVEYGPTGFIEGTGEFVSTTNPYVLEELLPNQAYDYYVKSFCGSGFSDSTGPFTFTTLP